MRAMKKTFPLQAPGKDDARVRDKIRHEVKKYLRRSRRKEPPEGFAAWEFVCKIGPNEAAAQGKPLKAIPTEIDAVAETGASTVYIELIATPSQRKGPQDT